MLPHEKSGPWAARYGLRELVAVRCRTIRLCLDRFKRAGNPVDQAEAIRGAYCWLDDLETNIAAEITEASSIEELGLETVLAVKLIDRGYRLVGDLVASTEADLAGIPGVGAGRIESIKWALLQEGFSLTGRGKVRKGRPSPGKPRAVVPASRLTDDDRAALSPIPDDQAEPSPIEDDRAEPPPIVPPAWQAPSGPLASYIIARHERAVA